MKNPFMGGIDIFWNRTLQHNVQFLYGETRGDIYYNLQHTCTSGRIYTDLCYLNRKYTLLGGGDVGVCGVAVL